MHEFYVYADAHADWPRPAYTQAGALGRACAYICACF